MVDLEILKIIIAAISPLYLILKRHYDLQQATRQERLKVAAELTQAAEQWAALLNQTFDKAVDALIERHKERALEVIKNQIDDYSALDYNGLASEDSVIKKFGEIPEFSAFADACA